MKTIKIVLLSFLVSIFGLPDLTAQTADSAKAAFSPGIGLALIASTNGLGGDAVYNFHKRMSIRLGFETLGAKKDFIFKENAVTYAANVSFKTGSISLLFDYYLANHIFLSAGAGYNLFHVEFDGQADSYLQFGDIQIPKEKIGTFNFLVDPSLKISPYLGIGFGRTLGLKKKVGFAFELGGFYQGSPDITIVSSGLLSPTSNPDQQQAEKLEGQINQYSIYPVVKLSLSYKIVTF
ncbi:MAG: hypothetical protein D4R64_17850 [Porphyromonadaceae bacterium]|nr:MAG: hypothetical protein D4R64_17850 [Porphyromonadaceae bacterium]